MTVEELIIKLQKFDPKSKVRFWTAYHQIKSIDIIEMYDESENEVENYKDITKECNIDLG